MMIKMLVLAATTTGSLLAAQAGFDMAAMTKWESATLVRFHVVGVHQGRTMVVFGDYEGKADVTDRLTVDYTYDRKKAKIVGDVSVTDSKSELRNIKSDGTNCPPPTLKGDYEHFQYVKHTIEQPNSIHLSGTRIYPAASVSNYPGGCSMRPIPGGKEDVMVHLAGSDPAVLAMPIAAGSPITVSADRKTFSIKGGENWVWSFTPTVVQ